VLGQEHLHDPPGRDEPHQAPVVVDDGQGTLTVTDRFPCSDLLVDVAREHRRIRVHEHRQWRVGFGGQHILDASEAHEAAVRHAATCAADSKRRLSIW
jgi:hypothetical protein